MLFFLGSVPAEQIYMPHVSLTQTGEAANSCFTVRVGDGLKLKDKPNY
jgi:hypothetical protein